MKNVLPQICLNNIFERSGGRIEVIYIISYLEGFEEVNPLLHFSFYTKVFENIDPNFNRLLEVGKYIISVNIILAESTNFLVLLCISMC